MLENVKQIPGYVAPKITTTNVQRYGRLVEQFVNERFPGPKAYLVPHKGDGIPTGVQAVIRDITAFEVVPAEVRAARRRPRP